jgi:hypothetical protein
MFDMFDKFETLDIFDALKTFNTFNMFNIQNIGILIIFILFSTPLAIIFIIYLLMANFYKSYMCDKIFGIFFTEHFTIAKSNKHEYDMHTAYYTYMNWHIINYKEKHYDINKFMQYLDTHSISHSAKVIHGVLYKR